MVYGYACSFVDSWMCCEYGMVASETNDMLLFLLTSTSSPYIMYLHMVCRIVYLSCVMLKLSDTKTGMCVCVCIISSNVAYKTEAKTAQWACHLDVVRVTIKFTDRNGYYYLSCTLVFRSLFLCFVQRSSIASTPKELKTLLNNKFKIHTFYAFHFHWMSYFNK